MDYQTNLFKFAMVIVLILLSSFFSSAETAMTKVNQIRIQALAQEGHKNALLLLRVLDKPQKMLSTVLIGNNIVNMAVSSLLTTLTIDLFGNAYVGIATGILTLVILLFGEITPKTVASLEAEKTSLSYAGVIWFLMNAMTPLVWLVDHLGAFLMHLLRVDPSKNNLVVTENEIRTMVRVGEQGGTIENDEKEMIDNVFDFGDFRVKDVMIPRIDMACVEADTTYEELLEIFRKDMHTRFPVYEDDTENVIGIVNVKDLILMKEKDFKVREILREAYFTYEQKMIRDLMVEMRRQRVSIAIVLDEYGATAGLVTLEDMLEELVGEIRDEYDQDEEEELVAVIPGREYIAQGQTKLSSINEAFDLSLESEDNDSLGGYLTEQLDRMPEEGDHVEVEGGIRFVIDRVEKNRIEQAHVWVPEKQAEAEEG